VLKKKKTIVMSQNLVWIMLQTFEQQNPETLLPELMGDK